MGDGVVLTLNGEKIPVAFDSLCVHGDEPTAVMVARAVKRALKDMGAEIAPLSAVLRDSGDPGPARISA